jgi:hypothetical protein
VSTHTQDEPAAEVAAESPALSTAASGGFGLLEGAAGLSPARLINLQRAAGNAATGRLLQRQTTKVATATTKKAAAKPATNAGSGGEATADFTPFVPTADVQRCFSAGVDALKAMKVQVDHIVVIAGAVYVATPDGRPSGNFTRKGRFGMPPGVYIMDGSGTAQFGYRKGAAKGSWRGPIGWRDENLPEDIRKLAQERETALKAQGKTGPTIFLHDFIDITEQQEEKDFGAIRAASPAGRRPTAAASRASRRRTASRPRASSSRRRSPSPGSASTSGGRADGAPTCPRSRRASGR